MTHKERPPFRTVPAATPATGQGGCIDDAALSGAGLPLESVAQPDSALGYERVTDAGRLGVAL